MDSQREPLIFFSLIAFSLLFHLLGALYLYDYMLDEGGWLLNAKNMVLFNVSSLEGAYYTALSPLNTFLHFLIFQIFSPSILIGRYINILFILCSLVVFYLFTRRWYGWKIAAFAVFIIVVNGIFNILTTFGILEPKVNFF